MVEVPAGSLELNCLLEGESTVFVVTVGRNDAVSNLKKAIRREREEDTLKGVGPHTLELWKVGAIYDLRCEVVPLFSAQGLQSYRFKTGRHSG
jgi:hypothetical protein